MEMYRGDPYKNVYGDSVISKPDITHWPSIINTFSSISARECYSAAERNRLQQHAKTQMSLKNILLSKNDRYVQYRSISKYKSE